MGQRTWVLTNNDIQMANEHMKICSTSYVIREIQLEITMRYHCTPIRVAKSQGTDTTKSWQGWGTTGMQSGVVPLCIYPRELKTFVHTKTCTRMFIAFLFITTKTWKQPRCPSVSEWINRLQYIETMEYKLVLKRNELSGHEKTMKKINVYYKVKEANLKGYMLYNSNYMTFLEKEKLWRQ